MKRRILLVRLLCQWRCAIVAAALLLAAISPAVPATALESETEIPLLRDAIEQRNFELLENKFAEYQRRFENGEGSEWTVDDNFETFRTTDPDFEAPLDAWNSEYPQSFAAPMARAVYRHYRARLAWEYLSAREIPEAYLRQIADWRSAAARDYQTALTRNRKLTVAYAGLMYMAIQDRELDELERIYEAGLKPVPGSAAIRAAYIFSWSPFLGLRYGKRRELLGIQIYNVRYELERHGDNPDFAWLIGYDEYVKAASRDIRMCSEGAIDHLTKAISQRGNWRFFRERGSGYHCLGNKPGAPLTYYKLAYEDLQQALDLNPNDQTVLNKIAYLDDQLCLRRIDFRNGPRNHCVAMLVHARDAHERDPLHPDGVLRLAQAMAWQNPDADLRPLLDSALVFGGYHAEILHRHAKLMRYVVDSAAVDVLFRNSIRMAPSREIVFRLFDDYMRFLLMRGSCPTLPTAAEIEEYCHGFALCPRELEKSMQTYFRNSMRVCPSEGGTALTRPLPMPDDVIAQ